jgi:hypothetical protein
LLEPTLIHAAGSCLDTVTTDGQAAQHSSTHACRAEALEARAAAAEAAAVRLRRERAAAEAACAAASGAATAARDEIAVRASLAQHHMGMCHA